MDFKPQKLANKTNNYIYKIVIIVLIIILAISFYFNIKTYFNQPTNSSTQFTDSEDYASVKQKLKNLVDIPSNENPTIIQVVDAPQLKTKNASLYKDVQNGDLLVVYQSKLVIFRGVDAKIVDIIQLNN